MLGTEILPNIATFIKVVILTIGLGTVFALVISGMHYYAHKDSTDEEKKAEVKDNVISALIAVAIVLVVYFVFISIAPIFQLLFYS